MTEGNQQAMELSDEQLMARVAARDSVAFGLLYDRHAAVVLGIAVKIVGDRTVGEEVLQETYWRVWTQAATKTSLLLRAWLFSIACRQALDAAARAPAAAATRRKHAGWSWPCPMTTCPVRRAGHRRRATARRAK
jgi:RNA polymerase sigma-70 factor (ECF subfamily)